MPTDTNQQQSFPNIPVALVDERRQVTPAWQYFFLNLWNRTGGAGGGTVSGPTSSTVGDVAVFNNAGGTALADSGYAIGTTGHKLVSADGANQFTQPQRMPAGSASAPGLPIGAGANGFYAPAFGQLALALLGQLRMLWVGNAQQFTPTAFAALPSPTLGMVACISDSTVNSWGSNITVGGGVNMVMAWYNGSNWTVMSK